MMQHEVTWCNMMQHEVTWCNMMQHDATWGMKKNGHLKYESDHRPQKYTQLWTFLDCSDI